ncbi:MAG: 6-bladed beta-propeller [Muribaculaceae bacterium]|jgi:hypothetical protein|nr:6-bladed beta-propeller [Muribaculaceae bacterium]
MTKYFSAAIIAMTLMAGCSGNTDSDDIKPGTINVDEVLASGGDVKASMLGKKISYIPLETTDSALIANSWTACVTDNIFIISNSEKVSFGGDTPSAAMAFDLRSGKFLNTIGRSGEGPGEYSYPVPVVSSDGSRLLFSSSNRKGWETYTPSGKYLGKVLPEIDVDGFSLVASTDSTITLVKRDFSGTRTKQLYTYSLTGALLDSLPLLKDYPCEPYVLSFNGQVTVRTFDSVLGTPGNSIIEVTADGKSTVFPDCSYWLVGPDLHFNESFCDTVYTVTSEGASPLLTFDMGTHSHPIEQLNAEPFSADNYIVTDLIEGRSKVLFGLSHGWLGDANHKEYIGIYDRESGTTVISPAGEGVTDDLSGFMPLKPILITPSGAFVSVVTADKILEWIDNNPDADIPAPLRNLTDDSNPVLVVIE